MYPYERSLVIKHSGEPFVMIGVNSDAYGGLGKTIEDEGINWRNFQDGGPGGSIATRWNVSAWPTIYLLDWDRRIRLKNVRSEALSQSIALLLAEQQGNGRLLGYTSALYSDASPMWSGTPRGKVQIRRNRRVAGHQEWSACYLGEPDEEHVHTAQRHRAVLNRGRELQEHAKNDRS